MSNLGNSIRPDFIFAAMAALAPVHTDVDALPPDQIHERVPAETPSLGMGLEKRIKPGRIRSSHTRTTRAERDTPTNAPAMTSLKKWKSPAIKASKIAATVAAQKVLMIGKYIQRITATAQTATL